MTDIYPTIDEQMGDDCFGSDNAARNLYNVARFLKDAGQIDDAKDLEFFKNAIDTTYLEQTIEALSPATRVITMPALPGTLLKEFDVGFTTSAEDSEEDFRYTKEYLDLREEVLHLIKQK